MTGLEILPYEMLQLDCYTDLKSFRDTVSNRWDLLICGFNGAPRAHFLRDALSSIEQHMLIQPEYGKPPSVPEHPNQTIVHYADCPPYANELELGEYYLDQHGDALGGCRVVVDATSLLAGPLLYLCRQLLEMPLVSLDVLYADPERYLDGERTTFHDGAVKLVRQVQGYEGVHALEQESDLLVVGAGFEPAMMRQVVMHKSSARGRTVLLGLPSLQADMYQQSRLQVAQVEELAELTGADTIFGPANNPFMTAQALHEYVEPRRNKITNLYLSPTGPKPQVLGFGIYWLMQWRGHAASVVLPFAASHALETSEGVSRIWCYGLTPLKA